MYKCEICGRESHKKIRAYGYTLCSKHMHQYHKHGRFLDNNPRTEHDLNDFRFLSSDIVEFDVYNAKSEVVGHFIIDAEDLKKIQYHKWRKDSVGHIVTGNCTNKNPRRELSRLLLDVTNPTLVVDHIDGDTSNNLKANLRICTQADNTINKHFMSNNTSDFIGVSFDKHRNRWAPEIRCNEMRCHLGRYKTKEEAVYVRYKAELLLFGEYRADNNDDNIQDAINKLSKSRQKELDVYVIQKLSDKGMLRQ